MTNYFSFRIAIPPIVFCISLGSVFGSGMIFGTGVIYGMMALGKKYVLFSISLINKIKFEWISFGIRENPLRVAKNTFYINIPDISTKI